jgi:hypothetical protein
MNGLRMSRKEDIDLDREIRVFHCGKGLDIARRRLWLREKSSCYTSKFLTSIMSHYHYHMCHTFVPRVANIVFSSCMCRIADDTIRTLDTPSKTC